MSCFCELPNIHSFRKAAKDSTWDARKHRALARNLKMDIMDVPFGKGYVFFWVCWGFMFNLNRIKWESYSWHIRMWSYRLRRCGHNDMSWKTLTSLTFPHPGVAVLLSKNSLGPDSPTFISVSYDPKPVPNCDHPIYGGFLVIPVTSFNLDHQYSIDWSYRPAVISVISQYSYWSQLHDLPLHMVSSSTELNLFQNVSISRNSGPKALDHFGMIELRLHCLHI